MKFKRLGLVFRVGLRKEVEVVERVFSRNGFKVVLVLCKVGRIQKEQIRIRDYQKILQVILIRCAIQFNRHWYSMRMKQNSMC